MAAAACFSARVADATAFAAAAAVAQRRELKLEAKFERGSSYCSFNR